MSAFVYLFVRYFGDKVSLCSSSWPQIHADPSASALQVLEFQLCAATPGFSYFFFFKSHAHASLLNYYLIPSERNSLK